MGKTLGDGAVGAGAAGVSGTRDRARGGTSSAWGSTWGGMGVGEGADWPELSSRLICCVRLPTAWSTAVTEGSSWGEAIGGVGGDGTGSG